MPLITGLPPILPEYPQILILGSMPSSTSLAKKQYYAHPRNAFWYIILTLSNATITQDYTQCVVALKLANIALWDVLKACERLNSLDSAITRSSEQANNIAGVLQRYPSIKAIALNGIKAHQCFIRHIKPQIHSNHTPKIFCLPSTSPANARMTLKQKLEIWGTIKEFLKVNHPL